MNAFRKSLAILAIGVMAGVLSVGAGAQEGHEGGKTKKAAAEGAKCPVCHMAMAEKKSKANPIAVKVGKKTYYCCSACKMHMDKAGKKKA